MKTIAWDLDDVLNGLTREWLDSFLRFHPDVPQVEYSDLVMNPPHQILGISKEAYLASLDEFRRSERGRNLAPDRDVLRWFEMHGDRFRHLVITATPTFNAGLAASWVMTHFGKWIRCFGFVPSPRTDDCSPIYSTNKGDFLDWIKAGDIFIDDRAENLDSARKLGMEALLYPQPWNRSSFKTASDLLKNLEQMSD